MLEPDWAETKDLQIVCFSNQPTIEISQDVRQMLSICDLVIALGNVDLEAIADALDPDKAAVAVLGAKDQNSAPPAPFKVLHGNGVSFNGWEIAGVSGALSQGGLESGITITSQDSDTLFGNLPMCDILVTHAPSGGHAWSGKSPVQAIDHYLIEKPPLYHICASDLLMTEADDDGDLVSIGVSGVFVPPPLVFA